jgi:hypothetical protein
MSRRKKIAALLGVFVAFSAGALAFIIIQASYEGSFKHKATSTGEVKEPLVVSFGETLLPGSTEVMTVTVNPKEKEWLEATDKATYTITSSEEATCKASAFEVVGANNSEAEELLVEKGIAAGKEYALEHKSSPPFTPIEGFELKEKNEATEQKCETAELNVKLKISGPIKYN